jgi:hypothetical protein
MTCAGFRAPTGLCITLCGELDVTNANDIRAQLLEAMQRCAGQVVVNLELDPWHRTPLLRRTRSAGKDVVRARSSPAGVPAARC